MKLVRRMKALVTESGYTDVCDCRSDANLDAGVALLGKFALEELVKLGVENTISNELPPLGDGSGLCGSHVEEVILFSRRVDTASD